MNNNTHTFVTALDGSNDDRFSALVSHLQIRHNKMTGLGMLLQAACHVQSMGILFPECPVELMLTDGSSTTPSGEAPNQFFSG